ncbi:BON domain-containing protein [Nitrolancea hollandica]|uniref:Putative Transport-associated n=1 Tax=Nitrolancea hollandica Lb TaxID=1129897 RepID=I4ELX8_9BACT|nr:BON domain-containing protein [Nitrolancea hollandica]CCF85691.1 putative Transport-associated [Nitrolancea hollandica Lb]
MPYYWTTYPYPHYRYYAPYFGPPQPHPITRSDADLAADVNNRLVSDTWVDATNIRINIHRGVVTLTGTVPSLFQKRMAGDDAWDTPGVIDVRNDLRIVPEA